MIINFTELVQRLSRTKSKFKSFQGLDNVINSKDLQGQQEPHNYNLANTKQRLHFLRCLQHILLTHKCLSP